LKKNKINQVIPSKTEITIDKLAKTVTKNRALKNADSLIIISTPKTTKK